VITTTSIGLLMTCLGRQDAPRAVLERPPLPALDSRVSALAPDGCRLAIARPPSPVLVLDANDGEIGAEHECAFGGVRAVAWRADGAEWAALDSEGGISVFDGATQLPPLQTRCSAERPGSDDDRRTLEYVASSSSLHVAFGSSVEVLDTRSRISGMRLEFEAGAIPSAVAASNAGGLIAIGDRTGEVSVWDTRTSRSVRGPIQFPGGKRNFGVRAHALDPYGRSLAVGAGDCEARIRRFDEHDSVVTFSHREIDMGGQTAIADVDFSPDGLRFVSHTFDWRKVKIWEVASGRLLRRHDFQGGSSFRMTSCFTDDGRFVFKELDGIVFDVERGTMSPQLRPIRHLGPPHVLSSRLAWTATDSAPRVYEIASGTMTLEREVGGSATSRTTTSVVSCRPASWDPLREGHEDDALTPADVVRQARREPRERRLRGDRREIVRGTREHCAGGVLALDEVLGRAAQRRALARPRALSAPASRLLRRRG
jgi:WD40 repeat protein